jgi:hypothetical protein
MNSTAKTSGASATSVTPNECVHCGLMPEIHFSETFGWHLRCPRDCRTVRATELYDAIDIWNEPIVSH